MPILLRFRGERSRLPSLSSSLSELFCGPAIAVEGGSWIGGMLEGPGVGARAEAVVIGGSWVSRARPGGGAGIVGVDMYGEAIEDGSVIGRRGSSEEARVG